MPELLKNRRDKNEMPARTLTPLAVLIFRSPEKCALPTKRNWTARAKNRRMTSASLVIRGDRHSPEGRNCRAVVPIANRRARIWQQKMPNPPILYVDFCAECCPQGVA